MRKTIILLGVFLFFSCKNFYLDDFSVDSPIITGNPLIFPEGTKTIVVYNSLINAGFSEMNTVNASFNINGTSYPIQMIQLVKKQADNIIFGVCLYSNGSYFIENNGANKNCYFLSVYSFDKKDKGEYSLIGDLTVTLP